MRRFCFNRLRESNLIVADATNVETAGFKLAMKAVRSSAAFTIKRAQPIVEIMQWKEGMDDAKRKRSANSS